MMASRHVRLLMLATLALVLVAPAASAHTAIFSADGKVRGSLGLLAEPVSTYTVTGLDLCFTETTGSPRAPISGVDATNFTATLKSPSGATFTAALEIPFGKPNCLTFEHPLVLTEPGQYLVDVSGRVNGTTFDAKDVKAGGEVIAREEITFPATVASDEELEARIVALEAQVAEGNKGIPAPAAALTFVLLALLAASRRLR